MEKNLEHIDNLFREGLGSYTEAPPPSVWDSLEERLDNKDKKRPGLLYRWYWFLLLFAFLGAGGASFYAWKTPAEGNGASAPQIAANDVVNQNDITAPDTDGNAVATAAQAKESAADNKRNVTHANEQHAATRARKAGHKKAESAIVADMPQPAVAGTKNSASTPLGKAVDMQNAIALNSEPEGNIGVGETPVPTKATVIRYIVKNSTHNNIAVAESEPVFVNERETKNDNLLSNPVEDDEDNMTFGSPVTAPKAATKSTSRKTGYTSAVSKTISAKPVAANVTKPAVGGNTRHTASSVAISTSTHEPANTPVVAANVTHRATVKAGVNVKTTGSAPVDVIKLPVASGDVVANVPAVKKEKATNTAAAVEVKNAPAVAVVKDAPSATDKKDVTVNAAKESKPVAVKKGNATPNAAAKAEKPVVVAVTKDAKKAKQSIANAGKAIVGTAPVAVAANAASPKEIVKTAATKRAKHTSEMAPTSKAVATSDKNTTVTSHKVKNVPASKAAAANDIAEVAATPTDKENKATAISKKHTADKLALNSSAKKDVAPVAKKKKAASHNDVEEIAAVAKKATKQSKTPAVAAKSKQQSKTATPTKSVPAIAASPAVAAVKPEEQPIVPQAKPEAPKPMATFKADSAPAQQKTADNTPAAVPASDSPVSPKRTFLGFEMGIKAGFEGSMAAGGAKKFVITPFLERKLSSKFSLLIQPGIKYAGLSKHALDGNMSFYEADNSSLRVKEELSLLYVSNGDTFWAHSMTINQNRDSVVKSYNVGGSYFEVELPLLLKYNITNKLSVYGGVNVNYSKKIAIHENTWRSAPKTDEWYATYVTPDPPPDLTTIIRYSGTPLSGYKGPMYPSPSGSTFRLGYMLGFSYQFNKRWLGDILMQQAKVKADVQGGYNINTALSATYFRLTVGYRLFQ